MQCPSKNSEGSRTALVRQRNAWVYFKSPQHAQNSLASMRTYQIETDVTKSTYRHKLVNGELGGSRIRSVSSQERVVQLIN